MAPHAHLMTSNGTQTTRAEYDSVRSCPRIDYMLRQCDASWIVNVTVHGAEQKGEVGRRRDGTLVGFQFQSNERKWELIHNLARMAQSIINMGMDGRSTVKSSCSSAPRDILIATFLSSKSFAWTAAGAKCMGPTYPDLANTVLALVRTFGSHPAIDK